jgi:hypothetical protein
MYNRSKLINQSFGRRSESLLLSRDHRERSWRSMG